MRVISMVPSWTETLLACGAEVVGRTRFCIHPAELVRSIPVVGGTKDIDWEKVKALEPDLIVLDRDENPKAFADEAMFPVVATHVRSLEELPDQLEVLSASLEANVGERVSALAAQWASIASGPSLELEDWADFPGVTEWLKPAKAAPDQTQAVYLIWREPWMAATSTTFIGSMLHKLGVRAMWPSEGLYPEFDWTKLPKNAVLLASSEPFPFAKAKFADELRASGRPCALVDGESFSWFGVRALEFLEEIFEDDDY